MPLPPAKSLVRMLSWMVGLPALLMAVPFVLFYWAEVHDGRSDLEKAIGAELQKRVALDNGPIPLSGVLSGDWDVVCVMASYASSEDVFGDYLSPETIEDTLAESSDNFWRLAFVNTKEDSVQTIRFAKAEVSEPSASISPPCLPYKTAEFSIIRQKFLGFEEGRK